MDASRCCVDHGPLVAPSVHTRRHKRAVRLPEPAEAARYPAGAGAHRERTQRRSSPKRAARAAWQATRTSCHSPSADTDPASSAVNALATARAAQAEIGWTLDPVWGHGYATELPRRWPVFAFRDAGRTPALHGWMTENAGSVGSIERLPGCAGRRTCRNDLDGDR